MKSFEEIISSGILNIDELENFRMNQKAIEKSKLRKALIICGCILFVTVVFSFIKQIYPLLIFVAFIELIVFLIWWESVKRKYVEEIKLNLIQKLISSIDESFGYQPKAFIPREIFKQSNFAKNYNSYSGEDYFFGRFDDVPVELSQLLVQQKSKNSSSTLFSGVFIAVEFKQPFEGRVAVVPDIMERTFGSFGRFFQNLAFQRDTLLKFDNPDFERVYAVYSNNEAEAKRIISGNMENYLMQLTAEIPQGVFFSYNMNKFFIGLSNRADILAVNIDNHINELVLKGYYDEIVYYLNLVLNFYTYIEENLIYSDNSNKPDGI